MTTITIGKRLIPLQHIALVMPYEPNDVLRTQKSFKSRVVLVDRESLLAEVDASSFVQGHGFRWVTEDKTAINPAVAFGVETFAPYDGFNPTQPYQSRLLWRADDGSRHSILLLARPDDLLGIAVRGEGASELDGAGNSLGRARKGRRKSRQKTSEPSPG